MTTNLVKLEYPCRHIISLDKAVISLFTCLCI